MLPGIAGNMAVVIQKQRREAHDLGKGFPKRAERRRVRFSEPEAVGGAPAGPLQRA